MTKLHLRLAIATSAGAVLASQAQGAVVQSFPVGAGIRPPAAPGAFSWDVDNDGTADFELQNSFGSRASFDDANGGRLVVPTPAIFGDGIRKLISGFVVDASMPGAMFHASAQYANSITYNGSIVDDASNGGWAVGDTGFFGFRFTSAGSTHYGWGELSITGTPIGQGFIINQAWYEETADDSITVGDVGAVPEPSSLGLLALGALGAACARRRRTAAAE